LRDAPRDPLGGEQPRLLALFTPPIPILISIVWPGDTHLTVETETTLPRANSAIENGYSVYRNREQLGNIVKTRGEFIAYNQRGKKVGKYRSALEASRAVLTSAAAESSKA
jgi:hypothetical protein